MRFASLRSSLEKHVRRGGTQQWPEAVWKRIYRARNLGAMPVALTDSYVKELDKIEEKVSEAPRRRANRLIKGLRGLNEADLTK